MNKKYVAFDVETPNGRNDRISSIGIAIIENQKIINSFSTLVNPETYFQPFHIQLTGINHEMVTDAPTFPQLWTRIKPLFDQGILLAHNAPFDMKVLFHCLHAYHIQWKPRTYYACTCRMGRACYPYLVDHKLDTMCRALHIELDHHKADSDSLACARLFLDYQNQGFPIESYIRCYDLIHGKTLQR